jgi:5-carboxymethyl-2-hydroxymuconate isomerase
MPHLIIEHSSDIKKSTIKALETEVQNIMLSLVEGSLDPDQCKCRSFSFDEYLVGKPDQTKSSFLHITIKILQGRSLEVRKKLSEKTIQAAKKLYSELAGTPSGTDQMVAIGSEIAESIAGIPQPHLTTQNRHFIGRRCDISVDIVEMEKETYQKIRIGN